MSIKILQKLLGRLTPRLTAIRRRFVSAPVDRPHVPVVPTIEPISPEQPPTPTHAPATKQLPELTFERDRQRSGGILKAYLPDWHTTEPGGGYKSNRGFFWMEYEVASSQPHRVKIQVEAPTRNIDPTRAVLKRDLVEQLRSAPSLRDHPRCLPNSRLDLAKVMQQKSTTVWIYEAQVNSSLAWDEVARSAILAAHEELGEALSSLFATRAQ